MIPALDPSTGFLPCGRYPTSEKEIEERFVGCDELKASSTRAEIWAHWQAAARFLRDRVHVRAAWIGGSFVTAKPDPGNLDVVWILNAGSVDRLRPETMAEIEPFAQGEEGALAHGLLIDSYVMVWRPHAAPVSAEIHGDPYFAWRGY